MTKWNRGSLVISAFEITVSENVFTKSWWWDVHKNNDNGGWIAVGKEEPSKEAAEKAAVSALRKHLLYILNELEDL